MKNKYLHRTQVFFLILIVITILISGLVKDVVTFKSHSYLAEISVSELNNDDSFILARTLSKNYGRINTAINIISVIIIILIIKSFIIITIFSKQEN